MQSHLQCQPHLHCGCKITVECVTGSTITVVRISKRNRMGDYTRNNTLFAELVAKLAELVVN